MGKKERKKDRQRDADFVRAPLYTSAPLILVSERKKKNLPGGVGLAGRPV